MLDWDDLRFFLALARHGTLSAAAKVLHVSQSTVGRRLTSLEATLAVRLLNRTPEGYVLTLAGEAVREKAECLEADAMALERDVTGRDARLRGWSGSPAPRRSRRISLLRASRSFMRSIPTS